MAEFPQIKVEHNVGNTITIPNQLDVKVATYLSSNIAVGVTTLPAENANDFSSGNILLIIERLGSEFSEIVTVSSHTNTAFTTGATIMAHNRGSLIQEINYIYNSVS